MVEKLCSKCVEFALTGLLFILLVSVIIPAMILFIPLVALGALINAIAEIFETAKHRRL